MRYKFIFLIDLIIDHCTRNKEYRARFNSTRLKCVINDVYKNMLDTLCRLNLIERDSDFENGNYSKEIHLLNTDIEYKNHSVNIKEEEEEIHLSDSRALIEYKEKYKTLLEDDIKMIRKDIKITRVDGKLNVELVERKRLEDDPFIQDYLKSSRKLKMIKRKRECLDYVNSLVERKENKENYACYRAYIERFNKENINHLKKDKNGRLYNYITNLPKELRCLYNLKFGVDISNCHPLLLCFYLIKKYNISLDVLNILYKIELKEGGRLPLPPHYVSQLLIENSVIQEVVESKIIPFDVLKYIYVCSNGLIWDDLASIQGCTRDKVKEIAFAQIFFNPYDVAEHSKIGKAFLEEYPNVYETIRELKKEYKNLPNKMMFIESYFMVKVLKECFKNGWDVINIHDCIEVLDTKANADVTPMQIQQIMNDVFKRCWLQPHTKVETYKEDPLEAA